MMMRPTPFSTASSSSAGSLLLPLNSMRSAGKPAERAQVSSPPETTSTHRPASLTSRSRAGVQKALAA